MAKAQELPVHRVTICDARSRAAPLWVVGRLANLCTLMDDHLRGPSYPRSASRPPRRRLPHGSQDWSHVLGELRLGDRRGGGAGERAPGALEAELTSSVVRTDVEVTERACPRTPDVRTCGPSVGVHVTRGRSMT